MTTYSPDRPLRALSLGAGVQSSTVALMACHGEVDLDIAIFADTGWEPEPVYTWLYNVLQPAMEKAGTPLVITQTKWGDVRTRFWEMPLFLVSPEGKNGMAHRQCTNRFKIQAVRQEVRRQLGVGPRTPIKPGTVTQVFGISWEETQRMSDSDVKFVTHEYPLIDRRMVREDCQQWLEAHGYGRAPRSACIGCPYHSDAEWLDMKRNDPQAFAEAVQLDEEMRDGRYRGGLFGEPFLHRKRIPLAQVRFNGEDDEPNGDCAGFCKT